MASEFKTVVKVPNGMSSRGFTPFQFSSRKLQVNTTQVGGLIPANPISSLLAESMAWYEMWINPEKVELKRNYQNKMQHTAGAIVTYHYRPDVINMSVSGACGWVSKAPQEEEEPMFNLLRGKSVVTGGNEKNSPRIFLNRLRNIADEPMYFIGLDGVEHYNTKYIKIYTKQYPAGVVCEGYFKDFSVPESGEDAQTINYSFNFTIESLKPISFLQKMAGMWGSKKGLGGVGGAIRSVPGFG